MSYETLSGDISVMISVIYWTSHDIWWQYRPISATASSRYHPQDLAAPFSSIGMLTFTKKIITVITCSLLLCYLHRPVCQVIKVQVCKPINDKRQLEVAVCTPLHTPVIHRHCLPFVITACLSFIVLVCRHKYVPTAANKYDI